MRRTSVCGAVWVLGALCCAGGGRAEACSRAFLKPLEQGPSVIATNGRLFGVLRGSGIAVEGARPVVLVSAAGDEVTFRPVVLASGRAIDVLEPERPLRPGVPLVRMRGWGAGGGRVEAALPEAFDVMEAPDEEAPASALEVAAEIRRATWRDTFRPCGGMDMTRLRVEASPPLDPSEAEQVLFHVFSGATREAALSPEARPTRAFLRVWPHRDDAGGGALSWLIHAPEGELGGVGAWVSVAMVDRAGNVGPRSEPQQLKLPEAAGGGRGWMVALVVAALVCLVGVGWVVWVAPRRAIRAHRCARGG